MNNDNVTGRDGYIMVQALMYAIAAIESLPFVDRETSNKEDMKIILQSRFGVEYDDEILKKERNIISRNFPSAQDKERPLVIPTGEPRWISEEEDVASPPSPRLRDEPTPEPAKKGKGMEDPSFLDELKKHGNRAEPRPGLNRNNFVDRVIRDKPKTDPEP